MMSLLHALEATQGNVSLLRILFCKAQRSTSCRRELQRRCRWCMLHWLASDSFQGQPYTLGLGPAPWECFC